MKAALTPAAISALVRGDMENMLVAMTPGGIEAQERAGRDKLVASSTLPIKANGCTWEQIEQAGIVRHKPVDDLFVRVTLPDGWKVVATSHDMNSDLVDNKGRRRGNVFYKAAFYDRSAHITMHRRYHVEAQPINGWETKDWEEDWRAVVSDSDGNVIWQTEGTAARADYRAQGVLEDEARAWINEHYPDWQDVNAYW